MEYNQERCLLSSPNIVCSTVMSRLEVVLYFTICQQLHLRLGMLTPVGCPSLLFKFKPVADLHYAKCRSFLGFEEVMLK